MADKGPRKPLTKRASRGAQQVARQDTEAGVSSRARKSLQGSETMADARQGARAGRNSKVFPKKASPKK